MKLIYKLAIAFIVCTVSLYRASGQQPMRLTSEAEYHFGGIETQKFQRTDTFDYKYKPSRTYDAQRKKWFYDQKIGYYWAFPNYDSALVLSVDTTIFDAKGNNIYEGNRQTRNGNWINTWKINRTFNSNDLLLTEQKDEEVTVGNSLKTVYRYNCTYDAQSNVDTETIEKYDYLYNCLNKDSSIYTYSGNSISSRLNFEYDCYSQDWFITNYRYAYQSGLADTIWRDYYDPATSTSLPYKMQSHHYTANNDLDTSVIYYWVQSTNSWRSSRRDIYLNDNKHNVLSHTIQTWFNGWKNETKDSTEYYPINVPAVYYYNMTWNVDSNNFVFDESFLSAGTIKYIYYYGFATTVTDHKLQNGNCIVYPNPAQNILNINFEGKSDNGFSMTIYNSTGAVVRHWNELPSPRYHKAIDISNLPNGLYLLRSSIGSNIFQQFSIAR